jgi:hypothetical protein
MNESVNGRKGTPLGKKPTLQPSNGPNSDRGSVMKFLSCYHKLFKMSLAIMFAILLGSLTFLAMPAGRTAANEAEDSEIGGISSPDPHVSEVTPSSSFPSDRNEPARLHIPLTQSSLFTVGVVIDNTANTAVLTDYQVSITIDTATPITQGDMRSDCGDIRFYDSDQITPLYYWLESGCNSESTTFWVNVPTIPVSSVKKIYASYGNSSLTSASNGEATFVFFDDFDGDTLDSKWTINGQGVVSVTSGYAYPLSYGSGGSWHGPVITASLPISLPQGTGSTMEAKFFWQHNSGDLGGIYHGVFRQFVNIPIWFC